MHPFGGYVMIRSLAAAAAGTLALALLVPATAQGGPASW
jgi:hypothetical protein